MSSFLIVLTSAIRAMSLSVAHVRATDTSTIAPSGAFTTYPPSDSIHCSKPAGPDSAARTAQLPASVTAAAAARRVLIYVLRSFLPESLAQLIWQLGNALVRLSTACGVSSV